MEKEERRARLIAIDEDSAQFLDLQDWYDRGRYLKEIIGYEFVKSHNPRFFEQLKSEAHEQSQNNRFGKPVKAKIYTKDWTKD